MLEDFAAGKIDLSVDALQSLAALLFEAEYDAELNLLFTGIARKADGHHAAGL